jgi:ribose transport system permease protein
LNLINVSSFWQLIVKGIIILIAVIIDSQKGNQSVFRRFSGAHGERAGAAADFAQQRK